MTPHDLSALVSSRICHDLISPIGAISNGVELMLDMSNKTSPELGLIGDSVNSASAKLRYFRIAFGATPPGSRIQMSEMRISTEAMFTGRTKLTFAEAPEDAPRPIAKLLLLALLCLEKSLPMGGNISVSLRETAFEVVAKADRIKSLAAQWGVLDGNVPEEPPLASDVLFFLLAYTLAGAGATFQRRFESNSAEIDVALLMP